MKTVLCIASLFVTLLTFQAQAQQQDHDAARTIRALYTRLYDVGTQNPDEASKLAAYCEMSYNLDYPALADALADRIYQTADATQQARFLGALQRYFVNVFAQSFSSINYQRPFEVNPRVINKSNGDVQVQTKAPYDATDVTNLNFIMRNNGGTWLIVDAIARGMSLTSQKYPEFKTSLDRLKGKYQDPLNRLAIEFENTYPACPGR